MTVLRRRLVCLAMLAGLAGCARGGPTPSQDPRRAILDAMLDEPEFTGRRFSELLRTHGPIAADEVGYLAQKARQGRRPARVNAARLLGLARADEAKGALRALAAETDDDRVFALAIGPLLEEPDAKTLAGSRPKLLRKALGEKGEVAAIALQAAWATNLPGVAEELEKKLEDPDFEVRLAAVGVLAHGAGPLEPKLRAILLDPARRDRYPLVHVYEALCRSDDPGTAEVIRRSLVDGGVETEIAFSNGVFFSGSRKPWLSALLVELSREEGPMRWNFFGRLVDWGDEAPRAELARVCVDHLRSKLPRPRRPIRDSGEFGTCRGFLGRLAGRSFGPEQLYEALDFGSGWTP